MIGGSTARSVSLPPRSPASAELQDADEQLARLGRFEARARLRLGELLDALFTAGGHHELGFSSERAYVLERCGQKERWARQTRGLARRLDERRLHRIRHAVVSGRITFSMAELLARHATDESEAHLLAEAEGKTLRAMKSAIASRAKIGEADAEPEPGGDPDDESARVHLCRRVGSVELLMVHASRPRVPSARRARQRFGRE